MSTDPRASMDSRVSTPAVATPDAFNLTNPSPTPSSGGPGDTGFRSRLFASPGPTAAAAGLAPAARESQDAARSRVVDAVVATAARNGQEPAHND